MAINHNALQNVIPSSEIAAPYITFITVFLFLLLPYLLLSRKISSSQVCNESYYEKERNAIWHYRDMRIFSNFMYICIKCWKTVFEQT